MNTLAGRAAIVTGSEQSIGAEIARALHRAGAKVMVTGIQDEPGAALARELGEGAAWRHTDVERDDQIEACLADCLERFGRLDVLVNCACSYLDSGLATPREHWLRNLNVTLVGAAIFTQKAAPLMTRPGGVIVNIGSVSGKFGNATRGPYSAGKAALMHFTRCAAAALGPAGIRVVTVTPAWTWSPRMAAMCDGDLAAADRASAHTHPLRRAGRMEEVAQAVLFAASDQASWINGCEIPVDGGYAALGPDQGKGPRHWFTVDG